MLHRLLTIDPKKSFVAGGTFKGTDDNKPQPLCVGDPYMDPWANPILVRGVPHDEKELRESSYSRKSLFSRVPDRPYYVSAGGGKSAVHPNDLVDVIADAEKSGGVTLRHIGTTTRFGLPDNCDHRPPNGIAPAPPIRSTALVTSK